MTTTISRNMLKNNRGLVESVYETFKVSIPANGPYAANSFVFRVSAIPADGRGGWKICVWSGAHRSWNEFAAAEEIDGLDFTAAKPPRVEKNINLMKEFARDFVAATARP